MTNKAIKFELVNSKEVVSVSANAKVVFPVQVRMELVIGEKTQTVAFGYNRLGGRQTYVVAAGKAPVVMSRADFVKTLMNKNIANMKQVHHHLNQLRSFHKDEFVVAKCACGGYVTAANVDYVQRNHAKLSEKLGREVKPFDLLCYTCQGHEGKAPAKKEEKAPVIPASAEHASCEHCGKQIKSQKVVEYSLKTYGKILCYKPCQGKHPKLDKKDQAPVNKPVDQPKTETKPVVENKKEEVVQASFEFSPGLVAEILALDVDRYSELGKLQVELAEQYQDNCRTENNLWAQAHQEDVARAQQASEASRIADGQRLSGDDLCIMCDTPLPDASEYRFDMCAGCVMAASESEQLRHLVSAEHLEEAKSYLAGASEASAMPQAEESGVMAGEAIAEPLSQDAAKGDDAASEEDTKEVPHNEASEESVCKTQQPAGSSNGSHNMADTREAIMSFMEEACHQFQDSDVPPMPEDGALPF